MTANNEMFVKLSGETASEINSLSEQFQYTPNELVRMGLNTVGILMRGKALGHKFFVATAEGEILQEWELSEPQSAVDNETRRILEDAFPTPLQKSIADLDPDFPKVRKKETNPGFSL